MKNKARYSLLSLIFITSLQVFAQSPIIVKGRFEPVIEPADVSVYRPYGGYFNVFYSDAESETAIQHGEFRFELKLERPGFIRLQSKGMPKTYFYAEPGDSIQILFVTDSAHATKTMYSGSNAGANNLLANRNLFNDGQASNTHILSIINSATSAQKVVASLDEDLKRTTLPLTDLLRNKQISNSCYEAMIVETEQKMLSWIVPFFRSYFTSGDTTGQVKLNQREMRKLVHQLFNKYDPYKSRNIIATTNYSNSHAKSFFSKKGILDAPKPKSLLWSRYDKKFGMVVDQVASIDYAPDSIQMFFLGTSLLTATVYQPMSDDDYVQIFREYYSKFPGSPFAPAIAGYLRNRNLNTVSTPVKYNFGVFQLDGKSRQLAEQKFEGVDSISTIQQLIKQHFKGNLVFVDFWATWCTPCIAEFRNERRLHSFLEENKVKTLYVSIDNINALDNWKKLVEKYRLNGFHYLANQQVYNNLSKWFEGIPRYILFDAEGNVLHDNLFRPSETEVLFNQISQLIKKESIK